MKKYTTKIAAIVLLLTGFQWTACHQGESTYTKIEPVHIAKIDDSEISKLTLTERAAKRIDLQVAPVVEQPVSNADATLQKIIPYTSIIYDTHGHTWLYTNPKPLVYIREEIKVIRIEGDDMIVSKGPPTGTMVVVQGAAELYGIEHEVGH